MFIYIKVFIFIMVLTHNDIVEDLESRISSSFPHDLYGTELEYDLRNLDWHGECDVYWIHQRTNGDNYLHLFEVKSGVQTKGKKKKAIQQLVKDAAYFRQNQNVYGSIDKIISFYVTGEEGDYYSMAKVRKLPKLQYYINKKEMKKYKK